MIDFDLYDKILIGIGEQFNTFIPEEKEMDELEKLSYVQSYADKNIVDAFDRLSDVLDGRDYFVVSTCTDDLIFDSRLIKERIVTPCGGFGYFQCVDDCSHELLPYESGIDTIPICPHCNKPVVFNRLPLQNYNEGGYLEQWQEYNKWLQSTVNKPLLILEVGVDLTYPTVIRFAFEKLAFFNKKSKMYRIHPSLAFATPDIRENCECIQTSPVEFLKNL